jgi:hypothetical protein
MKLSDTFHGYTKLEEAALLKRVELSDNQKLILRAIYNVRPTSLRRIIGYVRNSTNKEL